MARRYEVRGIDSKTIGVKVDDTNTAAFLVASDVQAENVYKSLDYHPGDTYELVDQGSNTIPEKPYEAFLRFLQSVIDGVNDVQSSNIDSVSCAGDTVPKNDTEENQFSGEMNDESIPF